MTWKMMSVNADSPYYKYFLHFTLIRLKKSMTLHLVVCSTPLYIYDHKAFTFNKLMMHSNGRVVYNFYCKKIYQMKRMYSAMY